MPRIVVETMLRRSAKGYVLGVRSDHRFQSWGKAERVLGCADDIARALPATAWTRLSVGEGTKGARLHDWAYIELADLNVAEFAGDKSGPWTRGLLICQSAPKIGCDSYVERPVRQGFLRARPASAGAVICPAF